MFTPEEQLIVDLAATIQRREAAELSLVKHNEQLVKERDAYLEHLRASQQELARAREQLAARPPQPSPK